MKALGVLYHLARADFLERVRRYSFLLTMAGSVYFAYAVIVRNVKLQFDDYRGINNSAWVGLQMALCSIVFLTLIGFYIVKDSIDRDLRTRVGQILATTPISKLDYLLGKTLSNFAVLAMIVAVLVAAAVPGQLYAGEDLRIKLWPLLSPFLLIALPALAFIAAVAVFFETIPLLRSGLGNVAYFALWVFMGVGSAEAHTGFLDLVGVNLMESYLKVSLYAKLPDYDGGVRVGILAGEQAPRLFVLDGIHWTPELISIRLYWLALALCLVLLATLFFDRFDPARSRLPALRQPNQTPGRWWRFGLCRKQCEAAPEPPDNNSEHHVAALQRPVILSSLPALPARFRFWSVLLAELRLALNGQRWWWYTGAIGLLIASVASAAKQAREMLLPIVWIWPLFIWSAMGTRESRCQTGELIFPAPRALFRQLPAAWLAGVLVAILMGSGVALGLWFSGDHDGLIGWVTAALFIPSLAMAMGVWSGSSRPFEAVYLLWWYVGPLNHGRGLDFMFTTANSFSIPTLFSYLVAVPVLILIALVGRQRQMLA
jgi:hypothetical protein